MTKAEAGHDERKYKYKYEGKYECKYKYEYKYTPAAMSGGAAKRGAQTLRLRGSRRVRCGGLVVVSFCCD